MWPSQEIPSTAISSHGTGCELSLTADETTLLLWLQIELLHVPRLAAQPGGSMLEIFHSTKCSNHFDVCWCGLDHPDLIEGKKRNPPRKLARTVVCLSLNTDVVNFSNEPQKLQDECIRTRIKL